LGATGTPFWMAPELLRSPETRNTAASDIYAFGIILYEVYSRSDPYCDETEGASKILKQIAEEGKRPPVPPSSPAEVQSLMTSCLLDQPDQRPTAEEIDIRLRRAAADQVAPKRDVKMSLFDMFPPHIAQALEEGRDIEPEHREEVTIFFSDIVGFTSLSATLTPKKVARMLDRLYHQFDELSANHDLYKGESIIN
jgi:guanylate cyclase, other